jgi:hypothetical protein
VIGRNGMTGKNSMKKSLLALAALTVVASPLVAQEAVPTAPAVPPVAIAPAATANAVLRAGTPVQLRLMEEITTEKKAAKVGQRFMLEVAAPVEINGAVVIPTGTPAWAEITDVRNKGMWGKSGKLNARLLFVRVNGRQIRLTGSFDDKGVTGTAGVIGAVALVPVVGFFVTGTSAVFPKGGEVGGFIDEDVELAIAVAAPAPMQVTAPAPVTEAKTAPASE